MAETDEQRVDRLIAWLAEQWKTPITGNTQENLEAVLLEAQRLAREDERRLIAEVIDSCGSAEEMAKKVIDYFRSRQPGGAK